MKCVTIAIVLGLAATTAALTVVARTASHCDNGVADATARMSSSVQLCQAVSPAAPHNIWAVDSAAAGCQGEVGWDSRQNDCVPWQAFAQGEYVGHARAAHVGEYRLRVGDQISFFYLRTRKVLDHPYQLQVGDRVRVESLTAGQSEGGGDTGTAGSQSDSAGRDLVVQPDGTISLPLLGQVRAEGLALPALRALLQDQYSQYYREPSITVTATEVDTRLEDLLKTVDARGGILGGLQIQAIVTPAGRINLPGLDSIYVQGLTLDETEAEINARYAATIPGVEVTPSLVERAKRFVFVVGEVANDGRFELEGPTTLMQAVALAGGWNQGANLRQVVVFRRAEDWRLIATMVDIRGALYARRPVPVDEIWLNDSDIVLVPKSPLQVADEVIDQVFVRGLYGIVPQDVIWGTSLGNGSTL